MVVVYGTMMMDIIIQIDIPIVVVCPNTDVNVCISAPSCRSCDTHHIMIASRNQMGVFMEMMFLSGVS